MSPDRIYGGLHRITSQLPSNAAPQSLATEGIGSLIQVANTFDPYVPAFLVRNLYWQQGSKEAGWAYRIGKITPDAMLGNSAHIANILTFLPTANFNFSIAVPDSGLGAAAVWYPHDRIRLMALFSDAALGGREICTLRAVHMHSQV